MKLESVWPVASSDEALAIEIDLAPAFHDCDPMHVVWHGHYFKYFEIARCALLQRHDYDYPQMSASGYLFPVVDARVKYIRSLRFAQPLKVRARITEWENRLKIAYEIFDADSGQVLARRASTFIGFILRPNGGGGHDAMTHQIDIGLTNQKRD